VLNRRRFKAGADFSEQGLAISALDAIDAHLDQLVRLEAAVDFGKDRFAEAVLADAGDGMQVVGAGAQRPAVG
jgi:hypothetical protein